MHYQDVLFLLNKLKYKRLYVKYKKIYEFQCINILYKNNDLEGTPRDLEVLVYQYFIQIQYFV